MIGALLTRRKIPKGIEALNRRDMEAYLKDWADDATLIHPGEVPGVSGAHTGKAAIRAFYQREFEQFPDYRITPMHIAISNCFDLVGNNVVALHWEAQVTNKAGFQLNNGGVSLITIRHGKVVHAQNFVFDTGEQFLIAWDQRK